MSIRQAVSRGRHGHRRGWASAFAFEFEHLESRRLLSAATASTGDTALFCQGPIVNGCLVQGATGQDYFPDGSGPAIDDTGATDSTDSTDGTDRSDDGGDVEEFDSSWIDIEDTAPLASRDGHITGTLGQFRWTLAADEYTVAIDWGDNTQSAGKVVANGDGSFSIVGSHDYATKGQYEINVTLTDSDHVEGTTYVSAFAHADTLTVTEAPDIRSWSGELIEA